MTISAEGLQQSHGVEMRVHGVGDHGLFGALGRPVYTGTVADRVRIGSLPLIPRHELKLIHWSRPNRRISRAVSWYLAYPFTLVNLAGFMGPARSEDPAERRLWWFARTAVVVSSLMVTSAMAMWVSVIVGTACRLLGGASSGLPGLVSSIVGPGLLACVVVHRILRGRPLVDQGNLRVALLTLGVLLGTAGILAGRATGGTADRGDALGDPVTVMVGVTTLVACGFAIALCAIAWRAEYDRKGNGRLSFRRRPDRTALAGAGLLIAFAVAILHTAGSAVRLASQTVLTYAPPVTERRARGAEEALPVLPIDLVPVLFLTMAAVFGVLFWREYRRRKPLCANGVAGPRGVKAPVPSHVLLRDTHEFLGRTGVVGLVVSLALCSATAGLIVVGVGSQGGGLVAPVLITLKIAGVLLVVVIAVFRPEQTVVRTKWALQSFADLAGFWAPDLHPLAGASYRLAVLRGLRRGVQEVRTDMPDKPIALVGHSQGAVICAWFVRGGHWRERPSENCSDEHALALRLHDNPGEPAERIALFTCGSPLGSLYRTFFPRYVNEDFVRAVAGNSHGNVWRNYWRATDPFGARLRRGASAPAVDRAQVCDVDVTEPEGEVTKGHYEYWQEGRVRRDVEEYFASFDALDSMRPHAPEKGNVQRRLRGFKVTLARLHLHGN